VLMRMFTPPLQILSESAAWLARGAPQQIVASPFCVANMLVVAFAWLVCGAAVP